MDKALEVIMVAMILVVAAVVILAMLQGRTGEFSGFTQSQVNSSDCSLGSLEFGRAISCSNSSHSKLNPPGAENIYDEYSGKCEWAESYSSAYEQVC
jgi:hypothetical protein